MVTLRVEAHAYSLVVIATQRQIKELVRESISRQPGEPKFFVDGRVFNSCWPKIWQWLNVQSLGAYLLKYDIIKDPTELFSLNKLVGHILI